MASLTYKFPQNERVVDILKAYDMKQEKINPISFMPMRDTYHMVGGSYIKSGNSPAYPSMALRDEMSVLSYQPHVMDIHAQASMPRAKSGGGFQPNPGFQGALPLGGVRSGGKTSGGMRKPRACQEAFPLDGGARSGGAKPMAEVVKFLAPHGRKLVEAASKKALEKLEGLGRKPKSARGQIVAKVMKEHGLALGAASRFVKEHGLA